MENLFSIKNKIAVVTGGAQGLGFVYTKALLSSGAKVVICDLGKERVEQAVAELRTYGDVSGFETDVTNEGDVQDLVRQVIEKHGQIDILVNNAGVIQRVAAENMDGAEWDRVMNVNLKGTFLCCRYFGEHMKKNRKGKIVNISSVAGKKALDLRLAYCTSKAGIAHYTKTLAAEWGPDQIQVNAIGPGYIKTSMNEDLRKDPVRYQQMVNDVPLGRFGEPNELVGTLLYLVSPASDYVTGQTIFVDGGIG
jgi:NAD(P)-dependent dehydrogenase (short-subunit alcohol dehydrogenase family)